MLTCREIPDNFPSTPQRLSQVLTKPSVNEFSAWMMLVAYLEQLPITHALVETLATFFKCDIRQSLHFVQSHLPQFANKQRAAKWTWRPQERPSAIAASISKEEIDVDESVVIDVHEDTSQNLAAPIVVPAWTFWPGRSFDMLSSNLLSEVSACASKAEEDKTTHEKVADAHLIESLSTVMDAVSVADTWGCHHGLGDHDEEVQDVASTVASYGRSSLTCPCNPYIHTGLLLRSGAQPLEGAEPADDRTCRVPHT